ncbi:MAG: hypothetical protein AAF340_09815 [Pseudomonadota bacterium]
MKKWVLASIYSAPLAAIAFATSLSSPTLDEAPFFGAPVKKVSLDLSSFDDGLNDRTKAQTDLLVSNRSAIKMPERVRVIEAEALPEISEELIKPLDLAQVSDTLPNGSAPQLEFAKQSTAFDDTAEAIAPSAYRLGNTAFAQTSSSLPQIAGFALPSSPSSGGLDVADVEPTLLEKTFEDPAEQISNAVSSVPLPAGIPLMASGLVLLGLLRRKAKTQ